MQTFPLIIGDFRRKNIVFKILFKTSLRQNKQNSVFAHPEFLEEAFCFPGEALAMINGTALGLLTV